MRAEKRSVIVSACIGIEDLKRAVRLFDNCTLDFVNRFTIPELILIYQAYTRSEWDIAPDRWTENEVELALQGRGTGATSER